ncbi:hypothetical protein [Arthrobacter sp. GMC3]|uniref:hypothetical protein n=1 Tax=Arthrobacter sp. GMC3 TaxID=2058894 RepID=UPI000CE46E02|nr:hypothetical protein [Arthrobacter sp. GMC3]
MTTRTCPECNTTFTPASPRQLFCRPECAHRQRQRKYRQSLQDEELRLSGHSGESKANSQKSLAALTALYEATIRKLRRTNKRKLSNLTRSFEGRLAEAYEQLNESAQAASRAQSKADELKRSVQRLQHENTARVLSEQQAVKDMQHLAAKVLTLHSDSNARLDPSTAAIFARRGWNTEMGRS